jgi:O-acetyl-ADP-ribose deacetylase (regulator of RNase III)
MIKYVKGDVVEAFKAGEIDVLVHGVNCQGEMNSGIAKQIREEFPQVFEEYLKFRLNESCDPSNEYRTRNYSLLLGQTQSIQIKDKFKFIVNAFTQNNYGYEGEKYCSYDAIDSAMKTLNKEAKGNVVIGMPKIGAGLGGGDWKVIEAIINSHFQNRDVFVYTLEELPKSSGKNDLG